MLRDQRRPSNHLSAKRIKPPNPYPFLRLLETLHQGLRLCFKMLLEVEEVENLPQAVRCLPPRRIGTAVTPISSRTQVPSLTHLTFLPLNWPRTWTWSRQRRGNRDPAGPTAIVRPICPDTGGNERNGLGGQQRCIQTDQSSAAAVPPRLTEDDRAMEQKDTVKVPSLSAGLGERQ
ncbi:hypothetical protein AAFF_G00405940 [Aldrovandia affinis]|uniref:Uncharacterized protein n=1 Tax=Aldrovandia affinis TaxID=143900 RepID=A0AAD7SC54_9TELE|nr:hypothetical protein AAFF_G00405940 [Aldrovandia affinis]